MNKGNWTYRENAYCFIRLLEWRYKEESQKEAFIDEMKNSGIFGARNERAIRLHFEYLDKITNGVDTRVKKDKYLVGLYKKQ